MSRAVELMLPEVARVFRDAVRHDQPPVSTVELYFDIPRSTAIRWLAKTRAAGLLPPSSPGRIDGMHIARTVRLRVCEQCGQLWPCDNAGEDADANEVTRLPDAGDDCVGCQEL